MFSVTLVYSSFTDSNSQLQLANSSVKIRVVYGVATCNNKLFRNFLNFLALFFIVLSIFEVLLHLENLNNLTWRELRNDQLQVLSCDFLKLLKRLQNAIAELDYLNLTFKTLNGQYQLPQFFTIESSIFVKKEFRKFQFLKSNSCTLMESLTVVITVCHF